MSNKLILKSYLAFCNKGTKKCLENFDITKQERGKNKPLPITTTTQLKQKIVFTPRATCPTVRVY